MMLLDGLPVFADPLVPLTRKNPETGEVEDVGGVRLIMPGGREVLMVNPVRFEELRKAVSDGA